MTRTRSKPSGLPIINPLTVGIDIRSRFHVAAVSPGLCDERFGDVYVGPLQVECERSFLGLQRFSDRCKIVQHLGDFRIDVVGQADLGHHHDA